LKVNTALTELDLDDNSVGYSGAVALREAYTLNTGALMYVNTGYKQTGVWAWLKGTVASGLVFELGADVQIGDAVRDSRAHIEFGTMPITWENGLAVWDLDNAYLERSGGGSLTEKRAYTHAYWIKWRPSDSGWRTLLRHSEDHCTLVEDGGKDLGVLSNRDGGFRSAGYSITTGEWRFIVAVGVGDSAVSSSGITTFYAGGSEPPAHVGTSDRVCSGMEYSRIGTEGQGPGKLAQAWAWDRALWPEEITALHRASKARYYDTEDNAVGDEGAEGGCTTTGGTAPEGTPCAFPFTYGGATHGECITIENGGVLWCSTTHSYQEWWGNCVCGS